MYLTDLRNLMINATAAFKIGLRRNAYVQRMQKELEFRRYCIEKHTLKIKNVKRKIFYNSNKIDNLKKDSCKNFKKLLKY